MLFLYILAAGFVAGLLPGLLKLDRILSVPNIIVGVTGALVGAFLGFGDAPLFLEYSILNEKTLTIATALLFVFLKVSITRKPT